MAASAASVSIAPTTPPSHPFSTRPHAPCCVSCAWLRRIRCTVRRLAHAVQNEGVESQRGIGARRRDTPLSRRRGGTTDPGGRPSASKLVGQSSPRASIGFAANGWRRSQRLCGTQEEGQ
ncbi:hypothetical protein MRS44_018428 [Fusarium solani]|uniref:uncharacterized protein n=1 Tax=Fusarium solani TaxID=169388 RepID=UPI0032C3D883|nr:hypothetical protein MRS44_018428 [Fusarium solani]